MEKKTGDFSMDDLKQLAQSDAARQLFALLQAQNGEQLQQALSYAASGDMAQAKKAMEAAMSSQQVQQLLRQLGG